jgi:hypothetical protein
MNQCEIQEKSNQVKHTSDRRSFTVRRIGDLYRIAGLPETPALNREACFALISAIETALQH